MAKAREQGITLRGRPTPTSADLLDPGCGPEPDLWSLPGDDGGLGSRAATSSNDFSSGRAGRLKSRLGFTLIELVVVIAILATIAAIIVPNFQAALASAKITRAIADIQALEVEIASYELFNGTLPNTLADLGRGTLLDPWGTPYQYLNFATPGARALERRDRFLVPINSTYDLYSMGQDKQSVPPITARVSRDDIIRANDGAYVGLASQY